MTVLEASAGTGKTYTLTALVARFVAEGRIEIGQLLMMTFTRAAAAEMRERTRARLVEVRDAIDSATPVRDGWLGTIVDAPPHELEQRRNRIVAALSALDDASITTIHGFCQQTLHELGVLAGDIAASEVSERSDGLVASLVRDELVRTLGRAPDALGPIGDRSLVTVEKELLDVVQGTLSNHGVERAPRDPAPDSTEGAWAGAVDRVIAAVAAGRLRSGTAGFDDLITGVGRLIDDAQTSDTVIRRMHERFRLVLIDEFQDTDTVQWKILRRIFVDPHPDMSEPVVICVGDPKQAIYRFRGADIDAYLLALDESGAQRSDLRTNFRADRHLVAATNELMRGLDLGRGRIPYVEVHPNPGAPDCATGDGISLDVRWLPESVPLQGRAKQSAGAIRERIAADLGDEVVRLLGTELALDDGNRPVEPKDIAVLVRANDDARPILEALRIRGVPTVQARIGSVTTSEAMDQFRLLAAGLANPSDLRRLRALGLGWFVTASESLAVAADNDQANADLQRRCDRWADELRAHGIVAFLEHLRTDSALLGNLADGGNLERGLTDLEHIVEIVHRRTKGIGISGAVLARILGEIATADEDSEIDQRRTDTDSTAVLLTSMHSAKGLEYPIVLVPFPKKIRNTPPFLFTIDEHRFIDTAPPVEWSDLDSDQTRRKALALTEIEEDERRLIYVTLTRPKHRLTIWWGQSSGVEKGSLARVLFHRPDAPEPFAAPKGDDAVRGAFEALQARIGAPMRFTELGPQPLSAPPTYLRPTPDLADAAIAAIPATAAPRADWFRWSFSSMAGAVGPGRGLDETRAGHDEGDPAAEAINEPSESAQVLAGDLLGLPASAAFGVLVHDVL
ncbi:MAG: UvrD-helicase domain-containing protein, partial [Actinomycetota bacterium]